MNKTDKYDEDLLRNFINSDRMEKAPEGFTAKTMARIQIETQSSMTKKGFLARNSIPLVSVAVIAGLIVAALIGPANKPDSIGSVIWQYIQDTRIALPAINNLYLPDVSLPGWTIYAAAALLLLAFLDRVLSGIFKKEN